jgi:ribosome-binding ATPase YchF (GTP1/OBG family)
VDALVHVVRAFESEVVPHPEGSIDPLRDARMLELELILADLGTIERRLERLEANIKKANKADDVAERVVLLKMKEALEAEKPLRDLTLSEEDQRRVRGYAFLSGKPLVLVVNMGEDQVRQAAAALERMGLVAFAAEGSARAVCAVAAPIERRWPSSRRRTRRRSAKTSA